MRKTAEWKIKICLRCGKEYIPVSGRQKWCIDCSPLVREEYMHQWLSVRPGYKAAHQDRDVNLSCGRVWRSTHREETRRSSRAYYITHKDEYIQRAHRRRTLGFIPLNQPFVGCERHHINYDEVIHIPKKLHRSIWHNVWTGKNMEQINALALEYL